MKLSQLAFGPIPGSRDLEESQELANRQGHRWQVLRNADDHDDLVAFDPISLENCHKINSQLELKCWLQDKEPI